MNPDAWLTVALVCSSGAMSPGPSLAVVLKNTVEGGRARGIACAIGHGIGVGLYAFLAVAGLTALVAAIEKPVMIGGALYLLWMGAKILRSVWGTASPQTDEETDPVSAHAPEASSRSGFGEGFAIAFLNPKIAIFFLAVLANVVPREATLFERSGVASLALAIDALWYVVVAAALAGTGAVSWLRRNSRIVDSVFGLVLVSLGVWVLVRSL